MDTKRSHSIGKLANVTNPDVSSDSSCVQSENESVGQGFTKVFNDDLIDTGPTARNSSTDATMLDERIDQIHTPFLKPQLPSIAERNHSVLTCPTGTCNLNTFEEPPSIGEGLQIFDDEVFSPPVTRSCSIF